MKRKAVESTTMRSVGYEPKSKTLEIEFESGEVYQYLEVPGSVWEGLSRAESKGRYFNREIREDYQCVRMGEPQGRKRLKAGGAAAYRLQWSSAKKARTTKGARRLESSMQHIRPAIAVHSADGVCRGR